MTQLSNMAPPSPPPPTTTSPASLLVRCLACEYDLRGLPRDARCPECGLAVAPSCERAEIEDAGQSPPLRLSSTAWLRGIAIACCLMLAAALCGGIDALRVVRDTSHEEGLDLIGVAVGIGQLAATLAALWMFGTREPLESRRGRTARYIVRIGGAVFVALPFALMPLTNRFGAAPFYFSRVSIAFSVIAGAITWLIVRRLAAGARRAGWKSLARLIACFAWLAPPLWIVHATLDPYMPYKPGAEWLLNAHPIFGYVQALVAIPPALTIPSTEWTSDRARLAPWAVEALVSLFGIVLLVITARLFFTSAAQSPRIAPQE